MSNDESGRNHVISFVAPTELAAAIEVATACDLCSKSDLVRMSVAKELRARPPAAVTRPMA
jgi:hypothetical protein